MRISEEVIKKYTVADILKLIPRLTVGALLLLCGFMGGIFYLGWWISGLQNPDKECPQTFQANNSSSISSFQKSTIPSPDNKTRIINRGDPSGTAFKVNSGAAGTSISDVSTHGFSTVVETDAPKTSVSGGNHTRL